MNNFAPQMQNRRRLKRLSLRELSEAIGGLVSHEMLSRFEKERATPRPEVQAAISAVLGILTISNNTHPAFSLADIKFRKRRGLSKKEQDGILAQAVERFNLYFEVEQRTGTKVPYHAPFPCGKHECMESAANELRALWQLGTGPLPNLSFTLECKGIKLYEAETTNTLFDGFTSEYQGAPLICTASWLNANVPRKRMTLAHELGHIVLPELDQDTDSEEEYNIAYFAGAFLMPETSLKEALGSQQRDLVRLGEIIELKEYFGCSIKAIMVRAWQVGIISDAAYHRFRDFYDANNYQQREPGEYLGADSSHRYKHLVAQGVLEGTITETEAALHFQVPRKVEMDINLI